MSLKNLALVFMACLAVALTTPSTPPSHPMRQAPDLMLMDADILHLTLTPQTPFFGHVDKAFKKYVDDFVKTSHGLIKKKNLWNLTIEFNALEYSKVNKAEGGIIGICYWNYGDQTKPQLINIDPVYWKNSTPLQRRQLIFHEMGHCQLNRMHPDIEVGWFVHFLDDVGVKNVRRDQIYLSDGCPRTIMYPYSPPEICLEDHKKYYDEELFDNAHIRPKYIHRGKF